MTFRGVVKDGKVFLDDPGALPEGSRVDVRAAAPHRIGAAGKKPSSPDKARARRAQPARTLYDSLKPFIGTFKDLPSDSSRNIDHYLYGARKR